MTKTKRKQDKDDDKGGAGSSELGRILTELSASIVSGAEGASRDKSRTWTVPVTRSVGWRSDGGFEKGAKNTPRRHALFKMRRTGSGDEGGGGSGSTSVSLYGRSGNRPLSYLGTRREIGKTSGIMLKGSVNI
ncbi:hypothetical protein GWI33_018704 [Rhynchophorus ferrugineus]|uniref:Uncharacterized protein n=1 Tax=Rhynchophorus ferrugineus TaxID=354439 RepID=A0A834M4Y7_RHYFE|nr:hypothetical protein GWI33_018704 [Rhynchophorus ferrugineus]